MSFVDSLKKGLFGSEDEYDDQYIDDGPQMVNSNNSVEGYDDDEGASDDRCAGSSQRCGR